MTVRHTPGPWIGMDKDGMFNPHHTWSAGDDDANTSEFAAIWAKGKVIALVVHSSSQFYPGSHPSVDANSRIIAAAPDLLDALIVTLAVLQKDLAGQVKYGPKAIALARAAIAKAEGR